MWFEIFSFPHSLRLCLPINLHSRRRRNRRRFFIIATTIGSGGDRGGFGRGFGGRGGERGGRGRGRGGRRGGRREVEISQNRYDAMIYEAFSKLNDPNGSDTGRKEIALWFPDGVAGWRSSLHSWII